MRTKRNWCTLFGANLFAMILFCGTILLSVGVIVLIVYLAANSFFLTGVFDISSRSMALLLMGLEVLVYGVPTLVIIGAGCPDKKRTLKLSRPRPAETLLSIGMAVSAFGVFVFFELLTRIALHSTDIPLQSLDITISNGGDLVLWVTALCILPALVEEFAYRGVILGTYENHMRPVWAILLSSAVFGLLHMQFSLFYVFIGVGVILGWIAYRSRSIWVGVVFHFTYNLMVVLLSYLSSTYPFLFNFRLGLSSIMEGYAHRALGTWGIFAAVSAVIFTLLLLVFNKITKGRVSPKARYAPHPFVDWVPVVITLAVLLLCAVFSLFSAFSTSAIY